MSSIMVTADKKTIVLPKMRKAKVFPPEYNVLRRLYAAVVVQAVYDLENGSTNALDRLTAKWFLRRDAGFIADEFELDEGKLLQFVKERGGWY